MVFNVGLYQLGWHLMKKGERREDWRAKGINVMCLNTQTGGKDVMPL